LYLNHSAVAPSYYFWNITATTTIMCLFWGNDKINVIMLSLPYYYNDRNKLDYWAKKLKSSKLGTDALCFNSAVFHRFPSSLEFLE